jgi:hypothetical protein
LALGDGFARARPKPTLASVEGLPKKNRWGLTFVKPKETRGHVTVDTKTGLIKNGKIETSFGFGFKSSSRTGSGMLKRSESLSQK